MKLKKVLRTLLPVFALSLMLFDSSQASELECPKCHQVGHVTLVTTPSVVYAICGNCNATWLYRK